MPDEASPCPEVFELEDFREGGLEEPRASEIAEHVEVCERCSLELSERSLDDEFAFELRNLLPDGPSESSSALRVELESTDEYKALQALLRKSVEGERYEILGELGRGGMGVVLEVRDLVLQRVLAMKMVRTDRLGASTSGLATGRQLARFLEEVRITGQLDHPSIVPVHELGIDIEGHAFFTMSVVRGKTLHEVFEEFERGEGDWTWQSLVGVIQRVCDAVAYAHSRHIVHRDLKPANIMVGEFGAVYVMDWGVSKVMATTEGESGDFESSASEEETRPQSLREGETERDESRTPLLTLEGEVIGTPAYMAPEQALGLSARVDYRVDIYSLGAVLYRLLAKQSPYLAGSERATSREIWTRLLEGPPTSLGEIAPRAIPELVAICERAMSRSPSERYTKMEDLGADLRAWLDGHVVLAHRTGSWIELVKWARRNRGLASAIAASIVLVITSTWFFGATLAVQSAMEPFVDYKRLQISERSWEDLGPPRPVAIMNARDLLDRVTELSATFEQRRNGLDELRGRALEWTHADSEEDRLTHPKYADLVAARAKLVEQEAGQDGALEGVTGEAADMHELRAEVNALEKDVSSRRTWRFESTADVFEHDALEDLVDGLEQLQLRDSGLGDKLLHWLDWAGRIEAETLRGSAEEAWREARRSIAELDECPLYGGFELPPQLGLVPVGRNPVTGLWEFAHVLSGEVPSQDPDTGKFEIDDASCIILVLIPGGSFQMGAQREDPEAPNYDELAMNDEGPVHKVNLDPFFLSKFEVTQAQWKRMTHEAPSRWFQADHPTEVHSMSHPVEQVTWLECQKALFDFGLTFPTEAQWEYAALAPGGTQVGLGESDGSLAKTANIADQFYKEHGGNPNWPYASWNDGYRITAKVGSKNANGFGLHDMIGNVMEWVLDWQGSYDRECVTGTGERESQKRRSRVNRGGSFSSGEADSRETDRGFSQPTYKLYNLGVRPALLINHDHELE